LKCRVPGWAAKALTSTPLTLALAIVIGASAIGDTSRSVSAPRGSQMRRCGASRETGIRLRAIDVVAISIITSDATR